MSQILESLNNTQAGSIDIPANCYLVSVIQKETAGQKVIGGIKYGSAIGLDDIIQSFNMDPNETERLLIENYKAPSTLYFDACIDWNGASVDLNIVIESLTL